MTRDGLDKQAEDFGMDPTDPILFGCQLKGCIPSQFDRAS